MKIIMEGVSVMYPNENIGISRDLIMENDGEFLHLNFLGREDDKYGTVTLSKSEVMILRDHFNTILKNKLLED